MTAPGLWLLPVSLGGTDWPAWLPPVEREVACRIRHFIAENAKSARAELKRMGHPLPMRELEITQLPRDPGRDEIDALLAPLCKGHDVALMSEAGCPAVADPGARVVARAHERGMAVRPMVGPSSILLTLMASGLDGQRFAFHGYLPTQPEQRLKRVVELERESATRRQTQLFIETPYRNDAMFRTLLDALKPDTRLCIATDLTMPSQSIVTRRRADWQASSAPLLDRRPTVFALLA